MEIAWADAFFIQTWIYLANIWKVIGFGKILETDEVASIIV